MTLEHNSTHGEPNNSLAHHSAAPDDRRPTPTNRERQQLLVLLGLAILLSVWMYHRWQEQQDPEAFRAMLRDEQQAVRVQVEGDVARAGIHTLPGGSLVSDALIAAQPTVPLSEVPQQWRSLPAFDGMKLQIWKKPLGPVQISVNRMDGATMGLLLIPLDLNSASVDELAALPELGPKTAQAIVDFRQANGPFSSVDELAAVKGIGEKTIEGLRFQVIAAPNPAGSQKAPDTSGPQP